MKINQMKEMCFLISADQKRYIFLLKHLRDGGNVVRDEYPFTNTSALDLLIHTEVGICVNQQSTNDNCSGRKGRQQKGLMRHTFALKQQVRHPERHQRKCNISPWYVRNYFKCYMLQLPQAS